MESLRNQLLDEIVSLIDSYGFSPDIWVVRDFVESLPTNEEMRAANDEYHRTGRGDYE